MATIVSALILNIFFVLGFVLGRFAKGEIPLKKIKRKITYTKLGPVKRPTAKELFIRKNPKLRAEEDEMRKAFKEIKDGTSRR